jgi:hypothetical protein
MGIHYKGSQGQTERTVELQEEEKNRAGLDPVMVQQCQQSGVLCRQSFDSH